MCSNVLTGKPKHLPLPKMNPLIFKKPNPQILIWGNDLENENSFLRACYEPWPLAGWMLDGEVYRDGTGST
jgi:hypothetical protein